MSKPFYLTTAPGAEAPSQRWTAAFPDGVATAWGALLGAVRPGDTVWVPVVTPAWEARVAELLAQRPGVLVVVVSTVLQDPEGLRAFNVGARGYCHQLAVPAVLKEVRQVVEHGGLWLGPELVQRLMTATRDVLQRSPNAPVPKADLSGLSDRERQVAHAVAAGKSNKEVADQLHISERTVKAHLGVVFEKLGVRDRVQMVLQLSGGLR
jgi:two-component system, NarL family, nitrate/nitrite response regulator NarL